MSDTDIEIRLTTQLDDLRGDMRSAQRVVNQSLNSMRGEFQRFQGQLSSVRNLVIGSGIALLGKQALGTMSSFEQLQIRLNGVMGSVAGGEEAFAWIKEFAKDTPYQVDQVADVFVRLKAFGLDPMDGTMQALADTSARLGGGFDKLQGISLAVGQAWAKQKLQGEEIMQLVERGVPVWDVLAQVTGKNSVELEKLSQKGVLSRDVIAGLVDEFGRMNAGSTEALMASLSGQVSNLGDNVKNSLDDIRKAGGLDGVKNLLGDINAQFEETSGSKEYAKVTAQALNQVTDVVRYLLITLRDLGAVGVEVFAGLGAAATDSADAQEQAIAPLGVALEGLRVLIIGFGTGAQLIWHNLKFATMELFSEIEGIFINFSASWDVLMEQLGNPLARLKMRVQAFSEAASLALKGDFSGASESWRQGLEKIEAEVVASRKRIADRYAQEGQETQANLQARGQMRKDWAQGNFEIAQDGNDRIYRQGKYAPPTPDLNPGGEGGSEKSTGTGGGKTSTNSTNNFNLGQAASASTFAAELSALKAKYQLANGLRQLSIADEIAFWQEKRGLVEAGSRDAATIESKILQLQVREREDSHSQRLALDKASRAAAQKISEERLQTAEQVAQMEVEFGRISQGEYLQQLADFEAQRYEMARINMEERLALLTIESEANQEEVLQLQTELEVLREQHNRRLLELDMQAKQESMVLWEDMGASVNSLWNQGLQAMMQGTLTWKNAMNAIWAEMGKFFMLKVVADPLKKWAAAQATKLAMHMGFIQTEQAAEGAAAATSVATTVSTATAKIGAHAATAGAGAAESQASIPYIGPVLAIAAMGAILGSVMALKGNIKSARGGYDIPAGVNPVTQLHEQEMVLPAEHANTIRRLGEDGGGGGEPLPAVEMKGQRIGNIFMMQLDDLSKAMTELNRRGMLKRR
ncbi:tape measure protein (plasmid) [Microbulbifer sp. ANSA001]|uniref:tape measure protein n=1 Tax=Microbulbifer sp. ANSA001 TaxID=3243358 RepID=UPI004042D9F4